ncbi:MAG: TetR/AcrR family transcriptional regulator [Hyphomicrobiales bacterium]|nr:TetR/AcrR family transcriptional regulator [Hyphomicrobiales bacterium]
MRRSYRMDMLISGQEIDGTIKHARGPRARMYKLMLETAVTIANTGRIPSVSEIAEACEVSRATAYRYFPTQASLVKAIVVEALGPILEWSSKSNDALERIEDLMEFAYPRMQANETQLRASLAMAFHEVAKNKSAPPVRGLRRTLLQNALEPLETVLTKGEYERLKQALSLVFGIESIVVLSDVWRLRGEKAASIAHWTAITLVKSAIQESAAAKRHRLLKKGTMPSPQRVKRKGGRTP